MKIYVASAFQDFQRTRAAQSQLRELGHQITYDWTVEADNPVPESERTEEQKRQCAEADTLGVRNADALLLLTPNCKDLGCGCYIELGMALILGKPTAISGACRERTVFMFKKHCRRFETDYEAISALHGSVEELLTVHYVSADTARFSWTFGV